MVWVGHIVLILNVLDYIWTSFPYAKVTRPRMDSDEIKTCEFDSQAGWDNFL